MVRWIGGLFGNLFGNRAPRSSRRRRRPGTPGPGPPPGLRPAPAPAPAQRQVQFQNLNLTRAQLRELAQFEAGKIELYFNNHRHQFEYVRYLSNGVTGVSCKIRIKHPGGRDKPEFFVVKRTFRDNRQQGLRAEIRMLELLRGAQHILQLFYIPNSLNNPLIGAPGPTMFTEWIESGTLYNFLVRSMDRLAPLPNRLLLEFFNCFVHFCIAMAWPPRGGENAPHREEKMPTDLGMRLRKEQIAHRDMHLANGSLNPEGGGHGLVPILKLIDFDQADGTVYSAGINTGVAMNINDIGYLMRTIITKDFTMSPRPGNVTVTIGGTTRTFFTQGADLSSPQYNNLDPEIAALVQMCLAGPIDRPSLEVLHDSVTDLMRRATPNRYAGFPYGGHEYDNEIRRIVQWYMLDAE
ncbi:hypothetical protein F4859DRAFT_514825 [Xylaria cf. heliscus]|nr:hypothetical protein F4859DRAFT_514825 [Xylaria cf. heliscus]